jgi:VanZ family protein
MSQKGLIIILSVVASLMTVSVVFAQDGTPPTSEPFLDSQQVYNLLVYAVIGSLGTLGLLLNVDRVLAALIPALKGQAGIATGKPLPVQYVSKVLPLVIEGITVILVVLAVLILGLLRITTSEGTIGILAAIVGYVLGKGASKPDAIGSRKTAEETDE